MQLAKPAPLFVFPQVQLPPRVAICLNPQAGRGLVRARMQAARSALWGYEIEWAVPSSLNAYLDWLENLNLDRLRAVVIVGGDGSINRALPLIVRRGIPLISFPAGTANDLADEVGWKADWSRLQGVLDQGREKIHDLIEVNGVPFATVGGTGIGSHLLTEFNRVRESSPWLRRRLAPLQDQIYTLLTVKTLLLNRDYWQRLTIKTRGFHETLKVAALFVCNQRRLGGDMMISDRSSPADGRMEVVILTPENRIELLEALMNFKTGRLPSGAIHLSQAQLTLEEPRGRPIRFFGDGEILVESSRLELCVAPGALRLRV